MKKLLTALLSTLPLLLTPLSATADKSGIPNENAWKNANENAAFKHGHKDKDQDKDQDQDQDQDQDKYKNKKKDK
jgi:UPF0716 family protein affecting phage T7 exclusion